MLKPFNCAISCWRKRIVTTFTLKYKLLNADRSRKKNIAKYDFHNETTIEPNIYLIVPILMNIIAFKSLLTDFSYVSHTLIYYDLESKPGLWRLWLQLKFKFQTIKFQLTGRYTSI